MARACRWLGISGENRSPRHEPLLAGRSHGRVPETRRGPIGSNIRTIHYLDNCPTVLAGGGAGIKLGQHVVLPKDTPLCNVWLTLLNGIGVNIDRHGDSTGIVGELRA